MIKRTKKTPGLATTQDQQQLNFSAFSDAVESGGDQVVVKTAEILTVSQLTGYLQAIIEGDSLLAFPITVEGELSNVKRSSRGHVYFTLKDGRASINGILWASTVSRLKFKLEDGLAVYVTGQLEIYAPSGAYSIVGKKLEPVGVGPLQLAFQQIKEMLEAEGLFSEAYKKPIPEHPRRIAMITSRTGAVIHDMLRVIRQKNPMVDILLVPVAVQGAGAAQEIEWAVRRLNWIHQNLPQYQIDTLVIARGGGSFEDLFCFSEEAVVRAIFDCVIPVVTGIGHEPDFGLADAVADYSAATPTAAADWIIPDMRLLSQEHHARGETLLELMNDELMVAEYELDQKATRFTELVYGRLAGEEKNVLQTQERLLHQIQRQLEKREEQLKRHAGELSALSPLETLARGYAVATKDSQVLRKISEVKTGDTIEVRLSDGKLDCRVESKKF